MLKLVFGHGLRWLLAAIVSAGLLLCAVGGALAQTSCLTASQPIQGELRQVKTRSPQGQVLVGYLLELGGTACADVIDLDGAPAQLRGLRNVQIVASDRAGQAALERLVGARIRVMGQLDAPDPERHAGHVVLSNALLVAVLSGGRTVTPDTGPSAGSMTEYVPEGATPLATVAPPALAPDEYRSRLARFVEEFYLSGEPLDADVIRSIYASRVSYFGKRSSVEQIIRDKAAYYERWPERQFTLLPGSLEVRLVGYDGALYDLSFIYDFRVAAVGRQRSGRGYGRLQIDLSDGKGKIIRESGRVIERN